MPAGVSHTLTLPGGSGITSAGTTSGTRGAPLDVGVVLAGDPRSVGAPSHETWPGPRLGDGTNFPDERAAVERRKAGGCASPAAASTDAADGQGAFRRSASLFRFAETKRGKGRSRQKTLSSPVGEET